jgi:predicted amidophosphoribosyltransferase
MRSFFRNLSSIIFDEDAKIEIPTFPFKSSRFQIPIYAGSRLTPELSHLALLAKEENDLMARKFLAKLICDGITLAKSEVPEIDVILIPSSKKADRIRGIKHINELVKEVNKLRTIRIHELLSHTRQVRDQAKLSSEERMANMRGAFYINMKNSKSFPKSAYLVDDLVTSGSTILAAREALQVANIQLLGVFAACATMVFTE